jgi:hypothetical protein
MEVFMKDLSKLKPLRAEMRGCVLLLNKAQSEVSIRGICRDIDRYQADHKQLTGSFYPEVIERTKHGYAMLLKGHSA